LTRIVGVLPDVPAIDKVFDYTVPASIDADVRIGTMVRIPLHNRRVGGWVVAERDGAADHGRTLLPLAKVTGWGPPPALLGLVTWAARRWAGRRASLLAAASPGRAIRGLPRPPVPPEPHASRPPSSPSSAAVELAEGALRGGVTLLRLPPSSDPFEVVLAAARRGPALVLYPSIAGALDAAARLRQVGIATAGLPREWAAARAGGVCVVGARAAAWAPLPDISAVVVVDGHDEAYKEERAPTWHARDVAIERARRMQVPALVLSPCPDLAMYAAIGEVRTLSRPDERAGWPVLDVVDRRKDDPRTGLFSERLVDALGRYDRVICVLNRKGRARLLACAACGELARCERCDAAVAQIAAVLRCTGCGLERPVMCASCAATRMKALRLGVARASEELAALAGRPVAEVTAESDEPPSSGLIVGTEAALHRAGSADLVVFLDFDQELLAPRYRAAEQALALLARAGRLVGGRAARGRTPGRVMVQTRLPTHDVIEAGLHGDPERLRSAESVRRSALGFPPFCALAVVSGPAAPDLVARIDGTEGIEVLGPDENRWLLRAADPDSLSAALALAGRPAGRVRVEVDPLRI